MLSHVRARGFALLHDGSGMGHDWLFEVLADIRTYAERHGMSDLAAQIDATEAVARREVQARENDDPSLSPGSARRG